MEHLWADTDRKKMKSWGGGDLPEYPFVQHKSYQFVIFIEKIKGT
jgi:hypothetical protein